MSYLSAAQTDDYQIAIAKFFDGEGPDPLAEAQASLAATPPPQARQTTTLLNGFTPQPNGSASPDRDPAPRIVPQPESQNVWRPPFLIALLLSPFSLLTRLVGGTLSSISYLFSLIPRLLSGPSTGRLGTGSNNNRRALSPTDTAARFAREFDEEYGHHELHFFERGYAQAYDLAKKELKFLLVLLMSPEHEDTSTFVRETLLAPEVVSFINDTRNKIILWAGNVQDSEAYQVSTALNCSKFPFAALIVHTPQDSSTAMSTIARVNGLQPPSVFVSKLRTAINQQSSALERTRATRNEQQATRNLREEQNTAYERSLAQDRERTRQRREAEAAQRRAEQEAKRKAEEASKTLEKLRQWRQWRAQSIAAEPGPEAKQITRISVRMTSGERVIRKFAESANIEELYAFVECHEVLQDSTTSAQINKPAGFEHKYGFRLVSPMPRAIYDVQDGGTIGERIGRSGNLIVEPIEEDDEEVDMET